MTTYFYRAIDGRGKSVKGSIDANDQSGALRAIAAERLTPLEISTRKPWNIDHLLPTARTNRPFKSRGLALFLRQLSSLLKGGMRLDTALSALSSATAKTQSEEIQRLRQSVTDGRSLSQAMSAKSEFYPDYVVRLAAAGEVSGKLGPALARAAALLTRSLELRQKLVSALTYPAILVVGGILTAVTVVTYVLPQFTPIFAQSGVELPLSTRFLLATAELMSAALLPSLIALLVAIPLLRFWYRTPDGRYRVDRTLLALPLAGTLTQYADLSRASIALEELLGGGLRLSEALSVVKDIPTNHVIRRKITRVADHVRAGSALSSALQKEKLFPSLMSQMIQVGQDSGELGSTFGEVGRFMEAEMHQRLERLLTILTPTVTLLMGGLVASIIISVLSAVMKLNELAF